MKDKNIAILDMIAQNTIKSYDKELLKSDPDEIPLEEIIEFSQGLKIIFLDLSKYKSILGLTIFENCFIPIYNKEKSCYESKIVSAGTIIVDESLKEDEYEKQYRYILAHELAHWLIHQNYYYENNEVASKSAYDDYNNKTETEADLLALSLLMPKGRLKVAYDRLSCKLKEESTIRILAGIFNVTIQTLGKRLENMNILKLIMNGDY